MATFSSDTQAFLSNAIYKNLDDKDDKFIEYNGIKYKILKISEDPTSGFYGAVFQDSDDDLILVNRGTERSDIHDILTDAEMFATHANNQWAAADALAAWAVDTATSTGHHLQATGHSLGGTLAEMEAAKYGLAAETFNAFGAAALVDTVNPNAVIVNHMRATDLVSAAAKHIGTSLIYASEQDLAAQQIVDAPLEPNTLLNHSAPNPLLPFFNIIGNHGAEQWYGEHSLPSNACTVQ